MDTTGSRLQDPAVAHSTWTSLKNADRENSKSRAQVDGMINGADPFDQALLDETGQGDSANFNDHNAEAIIEAECGAYYDLQTPKVLVATKVTVGDSQNQRLKSAACAEEFSAMVKGWGAFSYWFEILTKQKVTHGLGVAFMPDEIDWRFNACGWSDFKLPRDTPATEEAIYLAASLRPMELSEMIDMVNKCGDAEDHCWDVSMLKQVVKAEGKKLITVGQSNNWDNWEYIEAKIKEGSALSGSASACKVWVIHFWVKEDDGTWSHGILPDSAAASEVPGFSLNWLYFNKSRYKSINDAFILFPDSIPISGTYHAIRGRGWKIQPQIMAGNALTCRMADGAMGATMNLLQVVNPSQTDMDRLAFGHVANNEVLPAGLNYIPRTPTDYTRSVLPVSQYLEESLRKNNTGAKPTIPALDRNAPAIAHQLEASNNAALSASSINRFYAQLDKLYTTMWRRATAPGISAEDPGGAEVIEFRKRLKRRGVTEEDIASVTSITAARTVGNGSAANRLQTFNRLTSFAGQMDPEGRRNLTFDIIAEEVGHELAERYIQPTATEEQRAPMDASIADFESKFFDLKMPCPVLPNQDHFTHVATHLPPLTQRMDGLEQQGENADPQQLLDTYQVLMTALPHIAQHANLMAGDRSRQAEVKGLISITTQLSAAADRLRNKIGRLQKAQEEQMQAEQKRAQDAQAAYVAELEKKAQAGGPDGSKAQALLLQAQVKAQIMESEHRQKMAHRQEEFNLTKSLKDAEMAASLLRKAADTAGAPKTEQKPWLADEPTQ